MSTKPSEKDPQKDSAKDVVKGYLDKRANEDPLFAVSYANPKKNIDECFSYILGEARKRGNSVCMTDEEVFGLAVHYYDEKDIKINSVRGSVSVSGGTPARDTKIVLTEEEKAKAREEALAAYREECRKEQIEANRRKTRKAEKAPETPNLFAL